MSDHVRNFDQPDEVIEVEKIRSASVNIGGISIARDIHQPGWRWSRDLRPLVGTEWCETHHLGYVLKGQLHILLRDGTEFDCRRGDLLDVAPGHDGWVVEDEPLETLSWLGGRTGLSPVHTLKERILVTLLFTDIVDSTSVAQKLGDTRWTELLRSHNQIMTDQVARHSGQIAKLTGDGVLAPSSTGRPGPSDVLSPVSGMCNGLVCESGPLFTPGRSKPLAKRSTVWRSMRLPGSCPTPRQMRFLFPT